ncbi:hypothetical protein HHK36_025712 [Tetracentron sinense]|uniref:Uncharacterized protein n=1 Tax=Tetracentron sinense TaxID=13715 RepID=A0A835D5U0_TETSI|nr:hypothetical protein HHK36_025712 [Tetracentron sinense]
MGSFTMRLTLISFYLLLCSFFIDSLKASFIPSNPDPLTDIACAVVNCGQGTCKASNATLLGFDCECNPGWKKIQIGPLTFPSCLVPNSCSLTWCGDGTCVANGTAYICNCNEGSANLEKNETTSWFHSRYSTIQRDRVKGHERLYNDYFAENLVYSSIQFRRRFRMRRPLFLRIQSAIEAHDPYFILKRNAAGTLGLSSLQKVTAAMRMLAYGVAADAVDNYVRIGESTSIESLRRFVRAVVEVFGEEYLKSPNNNDISRLLAQGEARGFPGMLGSIDCMHWKGKNCLVAWKCQYERGSHHDPSIILKTVASYDLWI